MSEPRDLVYKPRTPRQDRNIKYLTRDFEGFKDNLIKYLKAYFPDTIKDFHPGSSGIMLVELNAFVGDVLSFYLDQAFREMFLHSAVEWKNIVNRAKFLGYKPTFKSAAQTNLNVYCVVPAILDGATYVPDSNYTPYIKAGMQIAAKGTSTPFETLDNIDFGVSSSYSPMSSSIYAYDSSDNPTKFLLKKSIKGAAGETKSHTFSVTSPQEFLQVRIPDDDITDIIGVTDSNSNTWYEVDYLAQDTIFYDVTNSSDTNKDYYSFAAAVPYLLRSMRSNKRFTKEIDHLGNVYLRFGAGILFNSDEEITASPLNVPIPTISSSYVAKSIDPANYLKTRTLGEAPYNTTFTVHYRAGGGQSTNAPSNAITNIQKIDVSLSTPNNSLPIGVVNEVYRTIAVTNPDPATGGSDFEKIERIREYASSFFAAQNRVVTKEDYIARLMSMPGKYGSVAKAFVAPTSFPQGDELITRVRDTNQYGVNLYILSQDSNGKLAAANNALKTNIKIYLEKFRMLTDGINILDGKIINIRVHFKVSTFPSYNKNFVLTKCIAGLAKYFDVNEWQFSQPILISEIFYVLQQIEGIMAVHDVKIQNVYNGQYSNVVYDIESNTVDNVVFPSSVVSIFECKYAASDILGACS